MAERDECKNLVAGVKAELPSPQTADSESSASEYEEIIEEVTDYSDEEVEVIVKEKATEAVSTKSEKESATVEEAIPVDATQNSASEKTVVEVKLAEQHSQEEEVQPKSEDLKTEIIEAKSDASQSVTQTEESESESVEKGESLIPLLQDLLHKNMPQAERTATQNSKIASSNKNTNIRASNKVQSYSSESSMLTVSHNSNNTNKDPKGLTTTKDSQSVASLGSSSNQLNVPQREDSGTESGEDLRLIAAGIRDKLHMQSDTNLIQEVTTALNRLESSLKEGKDISLDERKRNALLALVARLQTGLTSPEKLADATLAAAGDDANVDADEMDFDETSSPEADTHRTNRQRFAKRRNRNSRHTVGVSREELEDARRYMEDMLKMENISNCTTPESNTTPVTPPQWFPVEKNASSGAILLAQPTSNLYRPNQFVPNNIKSSTECLKIDQAKLQPLEARRNMSKRPLSGDYSVSFADPTVADNEQPSKKVYIPPKREIGTESAREFYNRSPESGSKNNRFSNKKLLMKRANTIDIPKSKNYHPEFETDSEVDDKGPTLGLKRTVQVSVKQRVRNVVPPFEPKTENDRKFLAFINKQSAKPGLGWNNSRSVSNWTNKFGNIKNTFEVGAAASVTTGKPPPAPGHSPHSLAKTNWNKQFAPHQAYDEVNTANIQMQRAQQEVVERKRRLERERMERDRMERDRMERDRIERGRMEREHIERLKAENQRKERLEREIIEREYYERERLAREYEERERQVREYKERERLEREYQERERLETERVRAAQIAAKSAIVAKPTPVNQFIHAPQSVFRPIDVNEPQDQQKFYPHTFTSSKPNSWQSPDIGLHQSKRDTRGTIADSPQYLMAKPLKGSSLSNTTSPLTTSPIILPWVDKHVNNTAFKNKASRFEEKTQYEQRNMQNLHRHNSLRSANSNQLQIEHSRKRPSLPNTTDPYLISNGYQHQPTFYSNSGYPPAPTNISFTYSDYSPNMNYQSYPCLPTAVTTSMEHPPRSREDSLTNPQAEPLVLSSTKPTYSPQIDTLQPMSASGYQRQFDYVSPMDSTPTSPSFMSMPQTDCTDDDLDSDCNIMEYRVESKVMRKPQSQTAVTVGRKTNHVSDDEVYGKNSRAARNLLYTMKNLGSNNGEHTNKPRNTQRPEVATSPKVCLSPDGRSYQAPVVEPLFPQLTNFEANRSPLYLNQSTPKSTSMQALPTQYQQNPTYVPPSAEAHPYQYQKAQPKALYQKPMQAAPLPQQRNRNFSENSTCSSFSNNSSKAYASVVSPSSNWQANPMQVKEERREMPTSGSTTTSQYVEQFRTQQQVQQDPKLAHPLVVMPKPELRPKPQLPPLDVRIHNAINQSIPPQPQSQKEPKPKSQHQELQTQPKLQQVHKQTTLSNNQLALHSQPQTKQTEVSFRRQNTIDSGVAESRVVSEQLRITKEQKQNAIEMRRKSLGHISDVQQQHRKSTSFETQREFTQRSQQVYKSSAPMDTPDIVKSSLPKDENAPILKKFGPPQRHHYVPNAYQSPTSHNQTQTTLIESTNTRINAVTQKIVQHSSVTNKPTIVETPSTPQPQSAEDQIPRNIVYNNISAFTSMSRQTGLDQHSADSQNRSHKLSKCDSWSQIVQQQQSQSNVTPTKFSTAVNGNELRRTKSGHTLALPKMYEAGIDKAQVGEKQKTVAAYFAANKSPNAGASLDMDDGDERQYLSTRKSAINRTKTAAKVSTSRKSVSAIQTASFNGSIGGGLTRSATMPHIANLNLLDESNVEDAFEQLMMGS